MACAKQIVDLSKENKITAIEETLREMLLQPDIKDKNVCVVSIAGTFRQGKSFLLNFLIRYLRLKYKLKRQVPERWVDLADGNIAGFPWKSGSDRHTHGILMWSEIFLAQVPSGEEIAIIILDTQGTFDNKTTREHCAAIFAISTLISSVQIFNLKEKITQYDLEHLECFSGYGQLAFQEDPEFIGSPFQNLCFLIRDWPFEFEFEYGMNGGQKLLDKVTTANELTPELKKQKDNIEKLFENITCCLLPHPGQVVAGSPTFNGKLEEIDPVFIRQVEKFVPIILAPENLVTKTVNGNQITVSDLFSFIVTYCRYFSSGRVPPLATMYMAAAEAQFKNRLSELENEYKQAMEQFVEGQKAIKTEVLEEHHLEQKQKILELFNKKKLMGNADIKRAHRDMLIEKLDQKYLEYRKLNRQKQQTEEELAQQEEIFRKTREDEREEIRKAYDQEMQHGLDDLRNVQLDLERQLFQEKNKRTEETFQLKLDAVKKDLAYQDEMKNKEKQIDAERQKRHEDKLVHSQEMFQEQLLRKEVEKDAEIEAKIQEIKVQHMKQKTDLLQQEKVELEKDKEDLNETVENLTRRAEELKKKADEGCIVA